MIYQDQLHNQCLSNDPEERIKALEKLRENFSLLPDKQVAWNDLHRLAIDEDIEVRSEVASAIRSVFPYVPDKLIAWNSLIKLAKDEYKFIRFSATYALGSAFSHVPDKQIAWNDLHRLTNNRDIDVRVGAAYALGSAFSHVPDKQIAWSDLHRLAADDNIYVRFRATGSLGSAFSHLPDKQLAWNDLIELSNDGDWAVRSYANHSLGKICIFKASQAEIEEDYEKELEKAIEFFKDATQESTYGWLNPSQFCLPFYRSFHTIIFKKQEAKEEVNRYLAEAKDAVGDSKSKRLLFEAIENLANALIEVQKLENLDLQTKKGELNFYRKYCNRAAEIMRDTEEETPYATAAMRKGLPILDRNLKKLIEEIQKKAKITCKESIGIATQEIACAVSREVQKWEIGSQDEMSCYVPNIVLVLKSKIPHTPENKEILDIIESMKYEKDLTKQYRVLSTVIGLIPTVNVIPVEPIIEKIEGSQREVLEEIRKINEKLEYVAVSMKSGVSEELILHLGYITSVGGMEYTLTVPLKESSYSEIKEELNEIAGKRISQLSMMPRKIAKIVEDYLIKNKMEDLLKKLR